MARMVASRVASLTRVLVASWLASGRHRVWGWARYITQRRRDATGTPHHACETRRAIINTPLTLTRSRTPVAVAACGCARGLTHDSRHESTYTAERPHVDTSERRGDTRHVTRATRRGEAGVWPDAVAARRDARRVTPGERSCTTPAHKHKQPRSRPAAAPAHVARTCHDPARAPRHLSNGRSPVCRNAGNRI